MKQLKKIYKVIVMVMILSIVSPVVISNMKEITVYAATIKLNKTSLSLNIGKTYTLKVSGTKSKVTWSSSDKAIVSASTKGKITAIKEGTASVTAKVNKKKYTCKVTVKKPVNPLVTNAPFAAQEGSVGKFNVVFPKDWSKNIIAEQGNNMMANFYPSATDLVAGSSCITVMVQEKPNALTYDIAKEYFTAQITPDNLKNQMLQLGMEDVVISDFKTSDYETKNGTAFKTEYKLDYKAATKEGTMHQVSYDLYINNYLVEVSITDIADNATPDIYQVAEYLLDTIQLTK